MPAAELRSDWYHRLALLSAIITTPPEIVPQQQLPWRAIVWFGALALLGYLPVLKRRLGQWSNDEDMGDGFFVPVIACYIVWQHREELMTLKLRPSAWGLVIVGVSGLFLIVATLGAELFAARLSFVFCLIGVVLTLG